MQDKQKLWNVIKTVQVAMLTIQENNILRSRPVMNIQGDFDGCLYFFTKFPSIKIQDIYKIPPYNVCLSYNFPENDIYLSISGTATIHRNKKMFDFYWGPMAQAWFDSKDDSSLFIIRVDVIEAELWDAHTCVMQSIYSSSQNDHKNNLKAS